MFVTHVAGTRMMEQGTDGVYRGTLSTGVAVGESMIRFCPWAKSALETSPLLRDWITSWVTPKPTFVDPKDWFILQHDVIGGSEDDCGNWIPVVAPGTHVWSPQSAATDACLEELCKACMK